MAKSSCEKKRGSGLTCARSSFQYACVATPTPPASHTVPAVSHRSRALVGQSERLSGNCGSHDLGGFDNNNRRSAGSRGRAGWPAPCASPFHSARESATSRHRGAQASGSPCEICGMCWQSGRVTCSAGGGGEGKVGQHGSHGCHPSGGAQHAQRRRLGLAQGALCLPDHACTNPTHTKAQ